MPVQDPLRHNDQGVFPDTLTGKVVRTDGLPAHAGDGRIKTHGLLDHCPRFDKPCRILLDGTWQYRVGLRRESLPPFLRERKEKQRPGQGVGGGLVPGRDKG